MAIMSSFRFILVSLAVILSNENLFCNCEPSLYLGPYQGPTEQKTRCKRDVPIYTHQQPGSYQASQAPYPVVTSGVPYYHGNYQPIVNTVQQPMAYRLQPIQQSIYAQPGSFQPGAIAPQPVVRLVQPQQQVHYIQTKPAQEVEYIKPSQQVEYVEPSTSGVVKPIKPRKQIIKNQVVQSKPTDLNGQPVKYTIPTTHFVARQRPSQAYSMPTTYSQTYTLPHTSFTPYPQGHVIPEVSYPQGYPVPETSYPQVSPIPETSYPQGYGLLENSYPQGYPIPETSYPQSYPVYATSHLVGNEFSKIVPGKNYIDASPRYLLQDTRSAFYPHGNPNVLIFPNRNGEVNQLPETVNTSEGEIDVELIDVMPYKPGTEPIKKVPRVDSIEAIIKSEKNSEKEKDIDENNSAEPTTARSFISIFR